MCTGLYGSTRQWVGGGGFMEENPPNRALKDKEVGRKRTEDKGVLGGQSIRYIFREESSHGILGELRAHYGWSLRSDRDK